MTDLKKDAQEDRDANTCKEALDRFVQAFSNILRAFCDAVKEIIDYFHRLDSALDDDSKIWKLHSCRVCGRTFYTSAEAQKCAERHREREARSMSRLRSKVPVKYCGKRVAPRNREAALRRTELRKEVVRNGK